LTDLVRVLPETLFTEGAEEVKSTVLIKVILVEEFSRSFSKKAGASCLKGSLVQILLRSLWACLR
jgi:hypothetical protein